MLYMESVSYSLINGDQTGYFEPGCGLRQGILFPLIFYSANRHGVLCRIPRHNWHRTTRHVFFPHGNFWTTTVGSSPSLTWKSLMSARDLLIKGTSWTICSGRTIKVWTYKWLPLTTSNKPITPPNKDYADLRVCDLIDSEVGVWTFLSAVAIKLTSKTFPFCFPSEMLVTSLLQ
ncbi:hypothetical protein LIER_38250 [Lithospermum erythrorhizon]|uniref:Uncharacterized protein n=1 Tax=Lithospermum erythrorhizon TaxID=34254 RepID=A0AAV3PYE3_LITER